ncbi:DNA polymerase III subunit alpha [bacterium]|nr:DNA polymerase III subunit alpha [bacterium]
MTFTHLHVHSSYSLMRGTASLETLCAAVKARGMDTVALTDTNALYGLVFFLQIAAETGIRPIIGAEIVTEWERAVLLVRDRDGYGRLCRLITARHNEAGFVLHEQLERDASGLVMLSDSLPLLAALRGHPHLYAELIAGRPYRPVLEYARREGIPPAATAGVCFPDPGDYELHRLLRAIDLNTKLSRLPDSETASPAAWLMDPREMAARFPHVPEALENTARIADRCRFQGEFGRVVSSGFEGLDQKDIMEKLRVTVEAGARQRYGQVTGAVRRRIDYELSIIAEKRFGAIFLVVEDIVKQSPRTCGRGSAAASIVSYCLGITHVDPIRHNLYFERFLNPGRKDPPDIDVDFAWDERDAILDYVFEKYGPRRAAMVANHVGFRPRAAVREIAKVCGMPEGEIKRITDRLAHLWYWSGESVEEMIRTHPIFKGLEIQDPWPEIIARASRLEGAVRHLSVHCGGVVIVPDRLEEYVPVETAPKGVRIIQWEKDQTEDSGLVKIDLLGNRSLAVIRDAIAAVHRNTGRVIQYERFNPIDDPETQAMIARGDTMGVFYVESPATRQLQKKTGRGDYEHLVIHSSIIRPAANTYINEYVRRLKGEPWEPVHPILDRVLAETYGIMVYQEDVSKIAVEMAGFSPEQGDGLRKSLSKKRNHRQLSEFRRMFSEGAASRGIGPGVIDTVWHMILSFSGYSFCKPHSASYALVSFKSAWLRAHYPAEFMAAVISNRGGYYSAFAYISEARRMGLRVLPPDVNTSGLAYTGRGGEIRMGLMQLKGVKARALDELLADRERRGPFRDLHDLQRRLALDPADLRILVKAGCLDSIAQGRSRAELLWQAAAGRTARPPAAQTGLDLFDYDVVSIPHLGDYDFRTALLHEVEILGFPLSVHPLDLYEDVLRTVPHINACDMSRHVGETVTMCGWWVTNKMVHTKNAEPMAFISFEDKTALYETVFFPRAFSRYSSRFSPVKPCLLRGRIDEEFGALSLHVDELSFLNRRSAGGREAGGRRMVGGEKTPCPA